MFQFNQPATFHTTVGSLPQAVNIKLATLCSAGVLPSVVLIVHPTSEDGEVETYLVSDNHIAPVLGTANIGRHTRTFIRLPDRQPLPAIVFSRALTEEMQAAVDTEPLALQTRLAACQEALRDIAQLCNAPSTNYNVHAAQVLDGIRTVLARCSVTAE